MSIVEVFSAKSDRYAEFRPSYPDALYEALVSHCRSRRLAWDCATGSGQALDGLRPRFARIVATDASFNQLHQSSRGKNVDLVCSRSETPAIASGGIDFVSIAQALHWFDLPAFYSAVREVTSQGAIIAAWTYGLISVSPELDNLINHLYWDVVGPYWAVNRKLVDEAYANVDWPFDEIAFPEVDMTDEWTVDHFVGYLNTWSAVHTMEKKTGRKAIAEFEEQLRAAWGSEQQRRVSWPLRGRLGRVE